MRILLTGRDGQVGRALAPQLETIGLLTATSRSDLDLEDRTAIRESVRRVEPDLIINAAAWTAVDSAEDEPGRAAAVNHHAVATLAEEARRLDAALVHFSTDYVFDGRKPGAWSEDDTPAPLNVYGRTKLDGENAIRDSGVPHLILRLSWVYDRHGRNFLNTMMRLLRERPEVAVVNDQFGSPTWSRTIADATSRIIRRTLRPGGLTADAFAPVSGTFHVTGPGRVSWYDFAHAIRGFLAANGEPVGSLRGIPAADYPTTSPRPRNSVLSSRRLMDTFAVELPAWDAQLEECMKGG